MELVEAILTFVLELGIAIIAYMENPTNVTVGYLTL
jgi:hypothetical protein